MAICEVYDAWRFESPPLTVVLHPPAGGDKEWMRSVAADEVGRHTVFVQDVPEPWIYVRHAEDPRAEQLPQADDLAAACAVLTKRGRSQTGGKIMSFGLDKQLPEPLDGPFVTGEVYSPAGLEQHLENVNRGYIVDLVEQLRSPLMVIPFVGAGMSAPFGFPLWGEFLRRAATDFRLGSELEDHLRQSDYEGAAELLDKHDPKRLTDQIRHNFRERVDIANFHGEAVSYLPLLTGGPVITTNFDSVVEDAFHAAGRPLTVIDGPREDRIVRAVHRNQDALLKIHGSYDDRTFRVFTRDEYTEGYDTGPVTLTSLAWLTFTNRPLLFLGCSLESDRTVAVLAEIHTRLKGLTHYAVLAAHYSASRQASREKQLSDWGVSPIWYPPGKHDRVADHLRELVEQAGTKPMLVEPAPRPTVPPRGESRFEAVNLATGDVHPETKTVAKAIRQGEVVFFLGAYAHLGRLPLGNEFYAALANRFNCPTLAGDRSAVAAFVASRRGPHVLWNEVRKRLAGEIPVSPLYGLLSALPAFLRSRGQDAHTWIFTTNYDIVLERALSDAREPFHVLYYMEEDGLFAHTSLDGSVRLIERPEAVRDLGPGTVIVKLNGGIVHDVGPPESVVIASGQFERLAARIPNVLPECARAVLRRRSLLFLGHGLAEPDVKRMIEEYAAQEQRGSWAVQLPPHDRAWLETWREDVEHRERWGLATIECDLEAFISGLQADLLGM